MIKNGIKIIKILLIIIFFFNFCDNQSTVMSQDERQEKQEAADRISKLLTDYGQKLKQKQYQSGLDNLEKILDICEKYSFRKDFIFSIIDKKQYILQKQGDYEKALKVAFELEEMSQQMGKRKSPWNYLKIADSYLGLKDIKNTIKWVEKAVCERGFKKYKFFQQDKYKCLYKEIKFQKLLKHMLDNILLHHPAKNFSIELLDGKSFQLSDQKGRVVLVDFWNVDCPPCIKAFPELKNLYSQYRQKGLEIIGISLDTDKKKLLTFLKKTTIPWKIACSFKGWKDETVVLYEINATPSTWLIDRKGILQFYNLRGKELKDAVEKLIQK